MPATAPHAAAAAKPTTRFSADLTDPTLLHVRREGRSDAWCGAECTELAAVTRDHLICGKCWDNSCLTAVEDEIGFEAAIITTRRSSYSEYLASDHWQHMRELALEYYGDRCVFCNETTRLDVHHRTYERLGKERLRDIIVLCRSCHAKHHGKAA